MKVTSFTISRVFFLGAVGKLGVPETVTFSVAWGIENNETLADCEEKAIAEIYAMADRERKRRWGYLKRHAEEKAADEKLEKARKAAAGAPEPLAEAATIAS